MKYETIKTANYDYEDFYGQVFIDSECITDVKEPKICGEDCWYRVSVLLPIGCTVGCPSSYFKNLEDAIAFYMHVCSIVFSSKERAYEIDEDSIWGETAKGQIK
jgi:hypothetical protein